MDFINSSNLSRLRPADTGPARPGDAPGQAQNAGNMKSPVIAVDSVSFSDDVTVAIERLSQLDPPIDTARVARVKTAILEGSYPLDSQRIADSFFRDATTLSGR